LAKIDSDSGTDLIFRRLSLQAPQHYRRWVRAAIIAGVASYAMALAVIQIEQPWQEQAHPRELYVVLAGVVAAWLERSGKPRAAAQLMLSAIWLEMHTTLLTLGPRAAVGGVFPAVLCGVILFFGTRAGVLVALSSLLSVPGSVLAGPWLGLGPGLRQGDLLYLVAIEGCTLAIAFPLLLLMNTLSGVLRNAERDARRLRELIDGAPDAILVLNEVGAVEDANPSAEALFALPRAQLCGARFIDLGLSRPDPDAARPLLEPQTLGGAGFELLGPAGSEAIGSRTPLECVARTVPREDGSRDCLVMLRDISGRKAADARTAQLSRQLQQSQKLEALGKLAGGVAHDFNNLLMAVGGYAEALGRHDDARVRDISRSLLGLRGQAAGLTEHLVAFARKGMTQPRILKLSRVVLDCPRLIEPLVGPSITLQVDAPEPAFIYADPAQVEQVLLNLALNARDAMPAGGTLSIACRLLSSDGCVELRVADTGHGMDEATRQSAFEPFFTTKPRTRGSGLGLALVHGIVEASGGSIRLESAPGRGTVFTLSWPALELGSEEVSQVRSISPEPRSGSQHQRENQAEGLRLEPRVLVAGVPDRTHDVHLRHDAEATIGERIQRKDEA
jgi:PAS domain S-box-containing protein